MISMKFIILLIASFVIITEQQQSPSIPPSFSSVCQSGIREDNTNYIYCARRSLNTIPLFSKNNVVYDELVLSDNRIRQLTVNSFARIKVKKIFLNGNPIRHIDTLTFAKLENHLEELWLDAAASNTNNNDYEDYPTGQQTSVVTSDTESITGVPKAVINYLRNLNTLKLRNFIVKQLDNYLFKRLNRIEVLSLQFCSIERIEAHAFDSGIRNSLRELYLDGNLLQSVPSQALLVAQFKQLRVLSLSQNLIKVIASDSFVQTMLINPESMTFNTLSKLVKLDLSYNGLKQIDQHAFDSFNSTLEILSLQNNEINSYSLKFVQSLFNLRELNLDFNLINKLTPGLFVNSAKLQQLSMQGNSIQFEQEQRSGGGDSSLEGLMLRPSSSPFAGLVELQRLNLARNGIKSFGSSGSLFHPLRQLKNLILDKNHLQLDLSDEMIFDGLHQTLVNISLQNTRLKSINCLKNFEQLERVKLGSNELKVLDLNVFLNSKRTLTNLDVQNNQLTLVDYLDTSSHIYSALILENLAELDLSNNRLCTFDAHHLITKSNQMPKLRHLGLSQNPLVCDCHLLSLHEWVKMKILADKDMFASYGGVQWQCELSTSTRRVKFGSLMANEFVCLENNRSKCDQVHIGVSARISTSSIAQPTTSTIQSNIMSRLASFEMRTIPPTSILINWSLDTDANKLTSDSLVGFKLSYTKRQDVNSTQAIKTFLIDKSERKFKLDILDNLSIKKPLTYSVCLSVVYNSKADKFCKDIAMIPADLYDLDEEYSVKESNTTTTKSVVILPHSTTLSSVSSDYILLNSGASQTSSTVLSTLMISLLIILLFFVFALIAFIYVYVKRWRMSSHQKKMSNGQNISSAIGLFGNGSGSSLTSRKNYLSGTAVLYPAGQNGLITTANPTSTIDPRKIIIATSNGNHLHHQTLFNMVGGQLVIPADNSTVSSTLSSSNNNNSQNNPLINDLSPNNHLSSTTPTSFTHYIVQPGTQEPHYIAYDYNLGALIIPTNSMYHQQQQQQQKIAFLNSNNTNKFVNMAAPAPSTNIAANSDHVYCEIPSTLNRGSFRAGAGDTAGHHLFLLNNSESVKAGHHHFLVNNNTLMHNQGHMINNHQQQNSSSSLLLSTVNNSSASSSNSSSPQSTSIQSNSTSHTKYTNASII